jgi:hypothetical protein
VVFCIPVRFCPSSPNPLLPREEKGGLGVLMIASGHSVLHERRGAVFFVQVL